ncbi:MAG: purine-nucleoside phosphorylase [Desulfobulbaceae bacterium]|jgi:purine-nucleoside phosphorylase|nr:purine-nucleoside phosphorylase [Desulfobulbaceae bacterium]
MMDPETHRRQVEGAVSFLSTKLSAVPEIAIVLGTGLSRLADSLEEPEVIPYRDIPHFPVSTVTSHAGNLACGRLGGRNVAVLQGRVHCYEGYSAREVALPIRVLSLLGARTAIITNASGGLNPDFSPGTIMILTDHINLLGDNPLRGPNFDEWGPRFPDLSRPYDDELTTLARSAARDLGLTAIASGTYICIPGPSLETPAETRFLRNCGADAVGMSSIPEILVAVHAGMRVLGLSVVANVNDPDNLRPILLDDIVRKARETEPLLQNLIAAIVSRYDQ